MDLIKKVLVFIVLAALVAGVVAMRIRSYSMEKEREDTNIKVIQDGFKTLKAVQGKLEKSQVNIDTRLSGLEETVKNMSSNFGKENERYGKLMGEVNNRSKTIDALKNELEALRKRDKDMEKDIVKLNLAISDLKYQIRDLKENKDYVEKDRVRHEKEAYTAEKASKTPKTASLGTISFKK